MKATWVRVPADGKGIFNKTIKIGNMTRLQDIENVILNLYLSDFIHQSIQHKYGSIHLTHLHHFWLRLLVYTPMA